jgi:hypothetical protein
MGADCCQPSRARRSGAAKVIEVVEKDWRGWFIAAGEKPPIDYMYDFKPGLGIFILPEVKRQLQT